MIDSPNNNQHNKETASAGGKDDGPTTVNPASLLWRPIADEDTLRMEATQTSQSQQAQLYRQTKLAQEQYMHELHLQAQELLPPEAPPPTKIQYPEPIIEPSLPSQSPPRFLYRDDELPLQQLTNAIARSTAKRKPARDLTVLKKTATFSLIALSVVVLGAAILFHPKWQSQAPVLFSTDAAEMATVEKLIEQKRFQDAVPLLDKIIDRNPQLAEAFQARGKAYLGLHLYRQASDDFSTALSSNPRLIKSLLDRAACFYYLTEYDKAERDYDQIIETDSSNAAAFLGRAMCEEKSHKTVEAINDLESAIKIRPKYAEAYDELGSAYLDQEDFTKSIEAYTNSIAINPKSSQTFFNRGNVYCKDNQNARGIADYTMAIQLEPHHPEFLNNRGYTYLQDGSFEKAIADFTAAVLLDPSYDRAKQNLVLARSHTKSTKHH